MSKKIFSFCFWLFASCFALPALAAPITVQSVLFDSDGDIFTAGPLTVDPAGNPVQNGDFSIFRIPDAADLPVGNGIDDRTSGLFDFRSDAAYSDFANALVQPHGKIFAATLELILAPMSLFANDQINLENGMFLGDPEIGDQLTNNPFLVDPATGQTTIFKKITLDLLDYYTKQQLENFLSGGTSDLPGFNDDGRILMTYGDDAIVSGALMRFTANIPEPGTVALISIGLISVFGFRPRKELSNG